MKTPDKTTVSALVFGFAVGVAAMWLWPQQELTAGTGNSSDNFSMVTVPVEGVADTEAVFILDHLTGILRGGRLNSGTGSFTHHYLRSIAADFQVRAGQKSPEYCIVSGSAQFNAGGNQPARGALYVAEKTSGAVIAYGFGLPRGRGNGGPMPLTKIDFFNFREGI
jgi:hypothetical protein